MHALGSKPSTSRSDEKTEIVAPHTPHTGIVGENQGTIMNLVDAGAKQAQTAMLGTWVWIGVADVESLFDEYKRKGANVRHPPTNYLWAYEMQIEDPDGNVLRLGSEPKEDQPVGNWLDMHGRSWAMSPDGGWRRVEA